MALLSKSQIIFPSLASGAVCENGIYIAFILNVKFSVYNENASKC